MTERAPGTMATADSISVPIRSSSSRSGPNTLMPTGVRMPVASMSMRPLIGIVHELLMPGNWIARSISSISRSVVIPSRHSSRGASVIVVSNMERGAGSVAVSARPALPNTRSTSGKVARMLSCRRMVSPALAMLMPGRVPGM